jgi:hypothetical protein
MYLNIFLRLDKSFSFQIPNLKVLLQAATDSSEPDSVISQKPISCQLRH